MEPSYKIESRGNAGATLVHTPNGDVRIIARALAAYATSQAAGRDEARATTLAAFYGKALTAMQSATVLAQYGPRFEPWEPARPEPGPAGPYSVHWLTVEEHTAHVTAARLAALADLSVDEIEEATGRRLNGIVEDMSALLTEIESAATRTSTYRNDITATGPCMPNDAQQCTETRDPDTTLCTGHKREGEAAAQRAELDALADHAGDPAHQADETRALLDLLQDRHNRTHGHRAGPMGLCAHTECQRAGRILAVLGEPTTQPA